MAGGADRSLTTLACPAGLRVYGLFLWAEGQLVAVFYSKLRGRPHRPFLDDDWPLLRATVVVPSPGTTTS